LPAIPDLRERLKSGPRIRIADVGCGGGWSVIALAQAYPQASVTGYDLDEASIADAQRNAEERGANVRFVCKDAAAMAADGPFDLVLLLETLHDMSSFDICPARGVQLAAVESNKPNKSRTNNDKTEDDRADDNEWVFHTETKYGLKSGWLQRLRIGSFRSPI